jgi:hypothetical protein
MFVFNAASVYASSVGSYPVPAASIVYDSNDQPIITVQESTIELRNGSDYYLKPGDSEEMLPLGYNPVAYNANSTEVNMFGSRGHRMYQVFNDGSVRQMNQQTSVTHIESASFYKLADRHYLFAGPRITDQTGLISASNFLYVVLDKLGNVTVLNDKYNTKILDQVTLSCNSVVFDVNRESLKLENGLTLDLTKISGSSSLYGNTDANGNKIGDNPSEIVIQAGNGGNGGSGGSGGTGGVGGAGGGGYNFKMRSALSLMGVEPRVNALDVDYAVMDPAMLLGSVFLITTPTVSDTSSGSPLPSMRNELNIEQYKTTIYDINPGTMYTVALGCKDYETGRDTIVDIIKVTTPAINYNVNVTRVALDSVHFTLKLDSNYVLDQNNPGSALTSQPMAVLYGKDGSGDHKVGEMPIDIAAAIQSGGWSSQINFDPGVIRDLYSNFSIKLEHTYYQGRLVSLQSGVYAAEGTTFNVARTFNVEIPSDFVPPVSPQNTNTNSNSTPEADASAPAPPAAPDRSTSTSSGSEAVNPGSRE